MRDRSVVRSSVMPSARYSWPGSPLRLLNGSTTIDSRGALPARTGGAGDRGGRFGAAGRAGWAAQPQRRRWQRRSGRRPRPRPAAARRGAAAGRPAAAAPACSAIASRPSAKVRTGRAMLCTRCSPHVLEFDRQPVADLVVHRARDADAARLRQRLQSGGDVDAVAQMSPPSTMTSPRLMPMRNWISRSSAVPALRSSIARCTSMAQRTASTTLANSASTPSPAVLTMRPRCSRILGSSSSRRCAFRRSRVPSSSTPIRRE